MKGFPETEENWPHPHHRCPLCQGTEYRSETVGGWTMMLCVNCDCSMETDYGSILRCDECPT